MKKRNFKFLFVCSGDTCRSPMANVIFRAKVKRFGIHGVTSSSAGLFVTSEKDMTKDAREALKFLGYRAGRHTAVQIDQKRIDKADIILTMTLDHKQSIVSKYNCADKTFSLSEFADLEGREVSDPYGKGRAAYIKCAKMIDYLVDEMIKRLNREDIIK